MSHRHHTLSPREAAAPTEPLTSHVGRSRWRALLLGAALMLLLMAILGVAVQSNFRRLKEANRWNVHTYQVLERIDRVGTLLDTHEADLRGFALTGNAQYLRRLKQTNGVGARALDELRQLTSDRPSQQQRLSILKPQFLAYRKRFISPWMTIALSAQNSAQAQRTVREQTALRGRESRSLQRKLRLMESTERALIQQRALELERAQRETGRALAWGCLFAALLAVGLLYLLARSVRAQQRANAQTARLNQSLIAEIAERRTVEESLRASETGFRHLAEDSLDMICRHAPDGTLTYVSPAARPLLGYAPTEMIGVHPRRFLYDKEPPDESKSAEKRFAAQLRETQRKPLLRCYRHANGGKVWLEVVGHAIVDSESGEVRAWHTSARDVSARVRQERERERLTSGLRAVVEIADALIVAPNEEELLRRAVEMMRARVGLKRCSIYLSLPGENEGEFAPLMRGRFGTDADGRAVDESELFYDTENDPHCDDIKPAPGERWIVRRDQIRYQWQGGQRVELPGRGWLARTPIATRADVIGLFFHDGAPGDEPHDAVDQQLVAVFCSLLGALIERGRSQARMNRQQRLLESVMQSAPLFLYSVDAHEKFTLATGNILPAIGFDPPAMIGRVMPEVMSQSSSSVVGMRRALKGETMQEEIEFAGRWLKMWRQPLLDETEQICGMIGIGMDVTQQRRAQLALQESEARYRQVADALQDVLFQTDGAAHWTFLNSAWSEITGYTVESSLSAPCARALHPDDRDAFAQLVETARTSSTENSVAESSSAESSSVGSSSVGNSSAESSVAESSSGESSAGESSSGESSSGESSVADVPSQVLRFMTQSGEVRWLEVALRANFGGAGEFRGTAGLLRDVTEQLRAENALRETLQMKRAILQGASYAIISTDADGVIQTFNPAAERMIGVSADEVVGKKQPTFFHDAAEIEARAALIEEQTGAAPAAGFEALVARGQIEGGHSEAEWSCIRADGTRFPMRISHSVLRGPGGEVTGHVAIGYDLTETRRAEMLKNEFISVVSHELRTPLTSIRGALGLLSGGVAGELPDRATQMIGIAQKNADRLVLLINDILDIEKIESGKMRFEMSVIALGELLETALESNRGYAQTLGVELELEPLPPALREATVAGDEPRLQQVLSNLLSNACKWTPAGSAVRLRALSAPDSTAENPRIAVEVQDAGPGVPPEFESQLFERFAQADGSATREKGGTGLGLAVTLAIVEKHGGSIGYRAPDAAAGRVGATFHFEMPADNVRADNVRADNVRADNVRADNVRADNVRNEAPAPVIFEARQRLLVIEDDEEVAEFLRAILRDAGYAVEVAHSRAQALELAHGGARFDGATLDLHLPDGHGLDLLRELRELPATRELPVVVVTSFYDERAQHCESDAVEQWFAKPVEPQQLLKALARWQRPAAAGAGGKARVLHVEDDDDVRRVVAMILGESSEVITASTLAQARACLQDETFDLALLDIGLPDGNGLDLVAQLSAQTPPVPTVIFSAREAEAETASNVAAALIKSRTPNETLRAKVEELLNDQAPI